LVILSFACSQTTNAPAKGEKEDIENKPPSTATPSGEATTQQAGPVSRVEPVVGENIEAGDGAAYRYERVAG